MRSRYYLPCFIEKEVKSLSLIRGRALTGFIHIFYEKQPNRTPENRVGVSCSRNSITNMMETFVMSLTSVGLGSQVLLAYFSHVNRPKVVD